MHCKCLGIIYIILLSWQSTHDYTFNFYNSSLFQICPLFETGCFLFFFFVTKHFKSVSLVWIVASCRMLQRWVFMTLHKNYPWDQIYIMFFVENFWRSHRLSWKNANFFPLSLFPLPEVVCTPFSFIPWVDVSVIIYPLKIFHFNGKRNKQSRRRVVSYKLTFLSCILSWGFSISGWMSCEQNCFLERRVSLKEGLGNVVLLLKHRLIRCNTTFQKVSCSNHGFY